MALGLAFIYVPLAVVVINSFNASTVFAWPPQELHDALVDAACCSNPGVRDAVSTSVKVGLVATADRAGARRAARVRAEPLRVLRPADLSLLVILPIALPGIVTALALCVPRSARILGVELSIWTVAVAHATFCIVVIFNNVIARLRRMGTSLEEASMDLGADTFTTFRLVTLPDCCAGRFFAGALLAFGLVVRRDRGDAVHRAAGRHDAADLDLPEPVPAEPGPGRQRRRGAAWSSCRSSRST